MSAEKVHQRHADGCQCFDIRCRIATAAPSFVAAVLRDPWIRRVVRRATSNWYAGQSVAVKPSRHKRGWRR